MFQLARRAPRDIRPGDPAVHAPGERFARVHALVLVSGPLRADSQTDDIGTIPASITRVQTLVLVSGPLRADSQTDDIGTTPASVALLHTRVVVSGPLRADSQIDDIGTAPASIAWVHACVLISVGDSCGLRVRLRDLAVAPVAARAGLASLRDAGPALPAKRTVQE